MDLPLEKRLRKRAHIDMGRLQDELMEMLYQIDPSFVLHGGTGIWRCLGGLRFSEDIDLYSSSLPDDFEKSLQAACQTRSLSIQKLKRTENLLFGKISDAQTEVRLEINFTKKKIGSVPLSYQKMDGSILIVKSIPAQGYISEKMAAYLNRKLIRDIYDLFFLCSRFGDEVDWKAVHAFAKTAPRPLDEKNLPAIVYSGTIPTFAQMVKALGGAI